jgi:uncharacterized protein
MVMRGLFIIFVIYTFFLLSGYQTAFPQEIPAPPRTWVSDYADLLSSSEEELLNERLKTFEDTTSNQIVLAIFPDAQGYPVEEFSIQLAEKWLVGQKGRDNGIILAVFLDERIIRIEVGYGLEDVVPDAIASQITRNVIPPYFREGKYYQGIYMGVEALMQATAGKYQSIPGEMDEGRGDSDFPFTLLIFFIIIFFLVFRRRRYSSVSSRGWRNSGPFWWGGMGGGSSKGGGFGGGFGGGGFSGGGGSFGGGGATGSW